MFSYFFRNNQKCLDALYKITDPLKTCFGIDIFWYAHLLENGLFYNICSHTDLFECGWENQCYKKVPYLIHPANLMPGYYYLDFDTKFQDALDPLDKKVTAHNSFLIIRKDSPVTAQFFGFASKTYDPTLSSFYCNSIPLLNKYIDCFISSKLVSNSHPEELMVDIATLRGAAYSKTSYGCDVILRNQGPTHLLKKIGVNPQLFAAAKKLSIREKQVLIALSKGKNSPQTGLELGLSFRTVQFYLENVKNKLGIFSREELAESADVLKMAGFLVT